MEAGDYPAALESRQKAFAVRQDIAAQDPQNAQANFDLAVAHADLSEALTVTGASAEALDHAQQSLSILRQLSAADPTNVVYSRNIGLCYEKFAGALTRLGSDERRARDQRIKDWTEARSWFQKGLGLFSDLRDRGTLMPADSEKPKRLTENIQECNDTIARLKM
jgi:tetratricopeptide (TPR) repeat protein